MKLRELIKVKDSLTNFANIRLSSAQDNYNVFKLYKQAEDEITNYNAQRDKIIIEYGEKDSEGNVSVQQNNPNFDNVIQAIVELEDLDIKIKFEKISVKSSELNLSAVDIFNLENFGLIEIKEGD
jgi:hypothetical protein